MPAVDLGVDHRHQHIAPGRDAMHFAQAQFVHDILVELAALRPRSQLRVLLKLEDIIRLRDPELLRLQGTHHIGNGAAIGDAETEHGAAGQGDVVRGDHAQVELARDVLDRLSRDVGRDVEHHLVRHEARLAGRRHAGEPALARQRMLRQPAARLQNLSSMLGAACFLVMQEGVGCSIVRERGRCGGMTIALPRAGRPICGSCGTELRGRHDPVHWAGLRRDPPCLASLIRWIPRQGVAGDAERNRQGGKERQHRRPSMSCAQHRDLRPAPHERMAHSAEACSPIVAPC